MRAYASVDLPDPFGPMIAWISFWSTARSTPLTISVPSSSATCRFLISSNAIREDESRLEKRFPARFVTSSLAGPDEGPAMAVAAREGRCGHAPDRPHPHEPPPPAPRGPHRRLP